ncbi:hypothetical protein D3C86_1803940 [compost metagenome]
MGLYIDNISLLFTAANRMTLRVNFMDPTVALDAGYNADFAFTTTNNNGVLSLTYTNPQPTDPNARAIEAAIPSLLAYFNKQTYQVRWVEDIIPQSKSIFGGLVNTTNPNSYLFGTL